jgi:hypothetical protein
MEWGFNWELSEAGSRRFWSKIRPKIWLKIRFLDLASFSVPANFQAKTLIFQ